MPLLAPAPVQSDAFLWNAETRTFSAEMSDLGLRGFGRVWDDSCDEGLTLVSSRRPGQPKIVFVVEHEERSEGDILWWDLLPADPRQRAQAGFTVRIWND